jgi:hypothetical protein
VRVVLVLFQITPLEITALIQFLVASLQQEAAQVGQTLLALLVVLVAAVDLEIIKQEVTVLPTKVITVEILLLTHLLELALAVAVAVLEEVVQ